MLVVDKNTTPLDWLKFELEQQQQHLHMQFAVHRAPSGHFSYIIYYDGRQTTGALRITQAHAANKLGLTVPELLEKFKLD